MNSSRSTLRPGKLAALTLIASCAAVYGLGHAHADEFDGSEPVEAGAMTVLEEDVASDGQVITHGWGTATSGKNGPALWLFARALSGFAVQPLGLVADARAELRVPLWRSDGIPFRDTFGSLGGRVAVTPACSTLEARATLAPIDVLDVRVSAAWTHYNRGHNSLQGYDEIGNTRMSFRTGEPPEPGRNMVTLTFAPTFKAKVGALIALYGPTLEYLRAEGDGDAPLVYEVFRDMTIEPEGDFVVTHEGAFLVELADGRNKPLVWIGASSRSMAVRGSGDRSLTVGPLSIFRPWADDRMPQFIVQGLYYLDDADYDGSFGAQFAVEWTGNRAVVP